MWEETPGPGAHDVLEPSRLTSPRRPPAYSFGVKHAKSQFISENFQSTITLGEEGPGPSKYDLAPPAPRHTYSFATADRSERAKFISSDHLKENFGKGSPGPAHRASTARTSFVGAPSQPFGRGLRGHLHAPPQYDAAPGSHKIDRRLGLNHHAPHNPPMYSFHMGKQSAKFMGLRTPREPKTETDHADLLDPDKKTSGKIQAPKYSFARSARFHATDLSDEDDLQEDSEATMGVTSSLSKSTSTLFQNSTSTLFGNAERLRGSQQEPFISAAHSRSNFGIDGPGPARYKPKLPSGVTGGGIPKSERLAFDRLHPVTNMPLPKGLVMPAPGTHTPNAKHTPRASSHLMGDRMPDKYVEQSPGPGEYDLPTVQEQRGTQVMSNTAGRDEKMRFISAFHAQSVLQGSDANPGPVYKVSEDISTQKGKRSGPRFGNGRRGMHCSAARTDYISAQHSVENQGLDGPGPTAYSPRNLSSPRGTAFGRASQRPVHRGGGDPPGPGAYKDRRLSPRITGNASVTSCSFGSASTYRGRADGRSTVRIL